MKKCPLCDTDYPSNHATCPSDGAVLIETREWEPGTIIRGKYRILCKLGRGGMGTVYKAEHIGLEEVRALKVMSASLAEDSKFVQRFRREAQAARRLRHVNTVHVDDLDQAEDGNLFISMDYVDGVSLRQLFEVMQGPLPIERALAIARGVAEGLGAADALKMVHRDIKPENILLARDAQGREVPKILDFGLVAMKESATALTTVGLMLTPRYAAPEQWQGMLAADLDGRTDLYALGGVLYEMLTGQTPFDAHNSERWMYEHLHTTPMLPSALRPGLGQAPGLDALVLKLLAKNREDRPDSAQAFLQELNLMEARAYTQVWTPVPLVGAPDNSDSGGTAAGSQPAEQERLDGKRAERERQAREEAESEQLARNKSAAEAKAKAEQAQRKAEAEDLAAETEAAPKARKGVRNRVVAAISAGVLCALGGIGFGIALNRGGHTMRIGAAPASVTQPAPGPTGKKIALTPPSGFQSTSTVAASIKLKVKDGLTYVWIPPGTFQMGCSPGDSECYDYEQPSHSVNIPQGFWMGQTEVTQEAYRRVTGQDPSRFKGDRLPVEQVNWQEAQAYCEAVGMRLPTEQEWEYAARAGDASPRYGSLEAVAWYNGNSHMQTHEVGQKQPNAWGLYDMLGNVWEWTASGDGISLNLKKVRGGSWYDLPRIARVSDFNLDGLGSRRDFTGVRCSGE
jgi:serine/threonine-protein kinase